MVQFSHLHMTTGKAIVLTRWTFVIKVMSLLFNTLSRFVIAFLPRSKHLLISRQQSPSTMILKTKKMGLSIRRLGVTLETFGEDQGENRSMDVLMRELEDISQQSISHVPGHCSSRTEHDYSLDRSAHPRPAGPWLCFVNCAWS